MAASLGNVAKVVVDEDVLAGSFEARCNDTRHHMGGMKMALTAKDGVVRYQSEAVRDEECFRLQQCGVSVFGAFKSDAYLAGPGDAAGRAFELRWSDYCYPSDGVSTACRRSRSDLSGRTTTRLGFGCSSVMGVMNRKDSLRMLDAAWDAGNSTL